MADVAHASLTGAQLHEPKGADNATEGTVYVSDGAGSGSWIGLIPVGVVLPYAGPTAPSRFLFCAGQAISRSTYATLFSAIGTTYGAGDGSTTFNLPDLRGRVVAGQDDMGGTSANRLTNPGTTVGGIDGDVLGGTGGAETHVLTVAQLAAHTHTYTASAINFVQGAAGSFYVSITGGTTGSTGSDSPHNNVQPTIILNYIIFTAVA